MGDLLTQKWRPRAPQFVERRTERWDNMFVCCSESGEMVPGGAEGIEGGNRHRHDDIKRGGARLASAELVYSAVEMAGDLARLDTSMWVGAADDFRACRYEGKIVR